MNRLLTFATASCPDPALACTPRPRPIEREVIGLGLVMAEIEPGGPGVVRLDFTAAQALTRDDGDEQALLRRFWELVNPGAVRLVSWGGRDRELPMLTQRALVYGIPAPGWLRADPRFGLPYRYAQWLHCDLEEWLGNFHPPRPDLARVARAVGLPGEFARLRLKAGQPWECTPGQIKRYCLGRALLLFGLYLRWALVSGLIDPQGHNRTLDRWLEALAGGSEPLFAEFLSGWEAAAAGRPRPYQVAEGGFRLPAQLGGGHLPSEAVL